MMSVGPAAADSLSQLQGRVLDRGSGAAVEGAAVHIAGERIAKTVTTDREGRYAIVLPAGRFEITIAHGSKHIVELVEMDGHDNTNHESRITVDPGEVIVIRDRVAPPVPPKQIDPKPRRAPPYSERAIVSDAWTKAHMLLEVSETGEVRRFKWLQRPGFDLEPIAVNEIFKLRFEPARDATGRAIVVHIPWSIEWPSAWWLSLFNGTRSGFPPPVGIPPRPKWHYMPCKGSGPLNGSLHAVYRDCSEPDLSKATREPWVGR